MNYYERHLGDYARDAGYLSMLEHGAYTLLMDRYYVTEVGIPDDEKYRVARAQSKEEKKAVDFVLKDFFTLENGIWTKRRIEEEIAKAQTKIKAAQENGKKGGRPKSNQNETEKKPSGFPLGYENETQLKAHQTPDTRHHITEVSNTQSNLTIVEPSKAASVCLALQQNSILDVNPSHPKLIALLEAGATIEEFEGAAKTTKVKKFSYVLGMVGGMREQALSETHAKGTVAPKEDLSWRNDDNRILLKAQSLKIHTQGKGRFELLAAIDAKTEKQRAMA